MLYQRLRDWKQRSAGFIERRRTSGLRRGAILLYHRVAEPEADPWGMAVSPAHFAEHMAVLRRYGTPRSMASLTGHFDEAGDADSSIAVTFDDGYADTLHEALPLLEAASVPATVYVIADAIGNPWAFWWDRLSEILLATPSLPETPCPVPPAGAAMGVDRALGPEAECHGPALAQHLGWSADEMAPVTRRQRLFLAAWAYIVALEPADRRTAITAMCEWAGVPTTGTEPVARPMSESELTRLAASPLMEIGGHTSTHADLSAISEARSVAEICNGRDRLVALTGQAVSSFAYPFGRIGPRTSHHVRAAGFSNATCSRYGIATARSDRFLLPRLHVRDCGGEVFERTLATIVGSR